MEDKQNELLHQQQETEERRYLENVLANLDKTLAGMNEELSGNRHDLAEAQRQVWEDETQLIRSFDDVITLSQIQQEYGTAQARIYDKLREKRNLARARNSPYFGRIDFAENDFIEDAEGEPAQLPVQPNAGDSGEVHCEAEPGDEAESIYIGPVSIDRFGSRQRLVYDWRTPVASLFYEQGLGPAAYRCPTGVMKGKLLLKRQYGIEDGKLRYWFDTDTKINDELLGIVLAESAATHLKTIVKSIQKEQNVAIRAGSSQDLIVIGPAGSGKSSVGMHRCAWLLYHYRDRITASNLLVISSSGLFADYVSGILPELGERELRRAVFSSLLQPFLPEGRRMEDRFEQMEWMLTHPGDERGIRVKSSVGFLNFIQEQMASLPLSAADVTVFDEVVCPGEELCRMILPDPHSTTATRIERLTGAVSERVSDYFEQHEEDLVRKLRSESDTVLFDDEIPVLLLKKRNEVTRIMEERFRTDNCLDAKELYLRFLREYTNDEGLAARTAEALESDTIPYEDILVLALLRLMIGEGSVYPQIVHILVDEAQDLSAFSHALIRTLFPKSRFTILADPCQRISRDGLGEEEIRALYPKAEVKYLRKSYRSTGPIAEYAQQFLPEQLRFDFFAREGEQPVRLTGNLIRTIRNTVEKETASGCTSVCVLTRTLAEAVHLAEKLPGVVPILDSNQTLPRKPVLMPLMYAKGLEFDAVISVDDGKADDQAKYVMATRALHRLYLADASGMDA